MPLIIYVFIVWKIISKTASCHVRSADRVDRTDVTYLDHGNSTFLGSLPDPLHLPHLCSGRRTSSNVASGFPPKTMEKEAVPHRCMASTRSDSSLVSAIRT